MQLFLPPPSIPSFRATPSLLLPPKPKPLAVARAATNGSEIDTFTEKSGYLFQLSASEADSLSAYDVSKIAAIYRRKPLILFRRLFQIATTFGRWFGVRYIDKLMERSDQMFKIRAAELRKILLELGPAYVKVAQAISSRPDLIPPTYLDELSLLQDRIAPFSNDVAFDTIQQELELQIDKMFSEISPDPVAAASLGQVYKARLRRSGQLVAVKVQRPGVQAAIALDIYILRFLAALVRKVFKFNTDLQAVVDEWASSLFREMDYNNEAQNGQRFRQLYGIIKDVVVPEMYVEHTTQRVLVMEWIEGQKLSEVTDLYLVEVGVYCSFNQLLEYGFYHADPHPGNLLRTYDGKLAYLDFGMMGEFRQELRDAFIQACLHLVNRDFDALAKDFVTLGYKFKFQIPSYFSLVIRSLAVLEGIAIGFNPQYKVLGSTYPWIAKKVLTDSSPQLKNSLLSLLYKDGVFRIDRLESLLAESLRARTERTSVEQQLEENSSKVVLKEVISFTLTAQGAFVREILLEEFAKGLDAFVLATMDSVLSATASRIPFSGSSSFSVVTEEDRLNLRTLQQIMVLMSGSKLIESNSVEVKALNRKNNQILHTEERSLVLNQPPSVTEILPVLSLIPELRPELQQQLLQLPVDLVGRLVSRAVARTLQRMFL